MLASAATGVYGLFTAGTSHVVVVAVLRLSGCVRSLQFTSLGAISFAEITRETMSQASSVSSMAQRFSQSMGVVVGDYALPISNDLQGHGTIVASDFWPAFIAAALVSATSLFFNSALARDAGAEISGQARVRRDTPTA